MLAGFHVLLNTQEFISETNKALITTHLSEVSDDVNTEFVSMKSLRLPSLNRIGISWSPVNVFVSYEQHTGSRLNTFGSQNPSPSS